MSNTSNTGQQQQEVDVRKMLRTAGPYPVEAFAFVREGLSFTVERVHQQPGALEKLDHHVSGQQLCFGLRDLAIEKFGLLAPLVLSHWKISRTDDFGRIVFAMIDAGLMSRTDEDTADDFRAVYDFDEAFSRNELLGRIATN
jgi:uncharacterized repeat protein (TIGR04138 family)